MYEISTRKMIGQVALTYVRRPLSSWFYRISTASYLLMYAMAIANFPGRNEVYEPFHAMGVLFVVMMLSSHWKQQMAYPQARLMPRYRMLQTVVFVPAVLLVILPLFAVFSIRYGLDVGLMILAVDTAIAAVVLWLAIGPGVLWGGVLFVLGWMWFISESGRIIVTAFLLANRGLNSLAVFGFGACCIICLIWRMWQSNDETPRFAENPFPGPGMRSFRSASSQWKPASRIAQFVYYPSNLQIEHYRQQRTGWQKIRRWQIGMISTRVDIMMVAGFILLGAILAAMYPASLHLFAPLVVILSVSMPMVLMGVSTATRIRGISSDFMLPVRREDYFRQLFLLCAISYLKLWVLFASVAVMFTLMFLPQRDREILPMVVCFSFALNALNLGACLWLSRIHEAAALMFAFFSNMSLPMILMPFSRLVPNPSLLQLSVIFSAMTLLGIVIAYDAYRRWLKVEIGTITSAGNFVNSTRRSLKLRPQLGN